jgi:hypothetical protein
MTMGDRIKSKRTLRIATYPTDNKGAPTGGQPAPAEASRVDGNEPEKLRSTKTDAALSRSNLTSFWITNSAAQRHFSLPPRRSATHSRQRPGG